VTLQLFTKKLISFFMSFGKLCSDKVNKDQKKAAFADELEKDALCLFQLRNALLI
jgi:hypothetical protein